MNIQPISELKNYNAILEDVKDGMPIYLTKNGKGMYAIITINDADNYNKYQVNEDFKKDINLNVEDMDFFVKDIESLNMKIKEGRMAAKKESKTYKGNEIFDELRRDIRAGKL